MGHPMWASMRQLKEQHGHESCQLLELYMEEPVLPLKSSSHLRCGWSGHALLSVSN